MYVLVYLCGMKLEEAIKSGNFADEQHKATLNILYTAYWLKNNFSMALRRFDITIEQHNVLRILRGKHPDQMCVKEIGSRMIEKSSNVPRIIDKLVEKKLAKRTSSKEDKRETLVSLTDKGIHIIDNAKELINEVTHTITALDNTQSKDLNELLEKMRTSGH
jgi:DNA-binding MarR family transcriptional regulator